VNKKIDLRSDTVTLPSEEMREAIRAAALGDDILGEDPTVRELEQLAASLLGMEDALLTISGTMANQIAVMAMTQRGQEVILGRDSHLYNLEVAGLAALSQVQARPVPVEQGVYDLESIEAAIQLPGVQTARTGLICLENTYNLNEGAVVTPEHMREIRELADRYQIPIYLDGARLFNAATALGVHPSVICREVDAVQICLTKGLGCPLGSILLGSRQFIAEARNIRQRLGGGMRQAGIIAAPGLIGLTKMIDRIDEDHWNATRLHAGLSGIAGIRMAFEKAATNIVSFEVVKAGWDADRLIGELQRRGIWVKKIGSRKMRMVTHCQISDGDLDYVLASVRDILQ